MRHLTDPKQLRGLFGFLHNEVDGAAPRPYVSDSWTLLKGKVLELGAHRVDGEEGTGRDLREVIQRIDSHELARTVAALNPIDLRTHTELGYDEGIDVGREIGLEIVWSFRDETLSLNGFIDQALDLARLRGYSEEYGYSDDFNDGVYRGITYRVETSKARVAALDEALVRESEANPGVPASVLLDGNEELIRSHTASYQHRQGNGTEELEISSPIASLMESVGALLAHLGEDYPATASEVASVAAELAEAGDADGYRELANLLQNEHDNPSDRATIAAVDNFILAHEEREEPKWIGATTEDPAITAENVAALSQPSESFDPDWDVQAPLPNFRFLTRLDANRRALLGDAIVEAALGGRKINVRRALNDEVEGVYVTDQGWELEDES